MRHVHDTVARKDAEREDKKGKENSDRNLHPWKIMIFRERPMSRCSICRATASVAVSRTWQAERVPYNFRSAAIRFNPPAVKRPGYYRPRQVFGRGHAGSATGRCKDRGRGNFLKS